MKHTVVTDCFSDYINTVWKVTRFIVGIISIIIIIVNTEQMQ